jgi:glycerophosphoryl diester phosphodiesterase
MRILAPAIIMFVVFGFTSQAGKPRKIIVIAHRGANRFAPENTLPAFKKAIELGCDYVELDVRRTKDGALVLMHDRTVDGKTNGHGAVEDLTLDEIRALDAGIKRGQEWAGTKVPTFDEALAVCNGRIKVYVDNKAGPVDEVLAAIEKHKMLRQVVIYGGAEELREFKKRRPRVWIMPGHPGSVEKINEMAKDLKPETMDGNLRSWTKEQVNAAHAVGVQVWVDNLGENDNEAGFQKALDMGVDAIQTDHPDLLISFLRVKGR